MALTYGEGIYGNADGVTSPLDHRLAQVTEFVKTTTPNLIRSGLLYNGTSTIVSGTSGMSYDVAAFSAVSSRGASQGAVKFANDATVNVATTAAPGSNSRYDVVYAWPRDYAIDGTDSVPVLGVVQGTAAASPTVPSLSAFPGAIELARILVPAGVVATNSGTTITQTAPFTTVDGGTVPFRNKTAMDLWTDAITGQRAWDLGTNAVWIWNGSSWAVEKYEGAFTPNLPNGLPSLGSTGLRAGFVVIRGRQVRAAVRYVLSGTGVSISSGLTFASMPFGSVTSDWQRTSLARVTYRGASTNYPGNVEMQADGLAAVTVIAAGGAYGSSATITGSVPESVGSGVRLLIEWDYISNVDITSI